VDKSVLVPKDDHPFLKLVPLTVEESAAGLRPAGGAERSDSCSGFTVKAKALRDNAIRGVEVTLWGRSGPQVE